MRRITLVSVVAVFALLGFANSGHADNEEIYEKLDLFSSVFERIKSDYVEDVEHRELIEAAIEGMLSSLDPHSSYLNADNFKNMQVQTRGQYGGLGMEVTQENGLVRVIAPIDDTPAARAGVQAGDLITHLDEESIRGWTLSEALDRMRGAAGTDIKLNIAREGEAEAIELVLTRAIIKISPVRARAEDDIAYLRITSFNEQTFENLDKSIKRLKEEIGPDLKGYILDLRNNPGGLLDQSVAVSDAFLDHGEIVSTRGRVAREAQRYNARRGDLADGKPVIVLVNGGSASASEIVAGALQDHKRALILGTQTFGKGSVQTIIPLGPQGALRLTTARYFTPSGRSIQARGIEPDIVVEQARVETISSPRRRSEADLRGRLDNPEDESNDDEAAGEEEDSDDAQENLAITAGGEVIRDYQLSYALDILRSASLLSSLQQ